jgi:hypothetical protein
MLNKRYVARVAVAASTLRVQRRTTVVRAFYTVLFVGLVCAVTSVVSTICLRGWYCFPIALGHVCSFHPATPALCQRTKVGAIKKGGRRFHLSCIFYKVPLFFNTVAYGP